LYCIKSADARARRYKRDETDRLMGATGTSIIKRENTRVPERRQQFAKQKDRVKGIGGGPAGKHGRNGKNRCDIKEQAGERYSHDQRTGGKGGTRDCPGDKRWGHCGR